MTPAQRALLLVGALGYTVTICIIVALRADSSSDFRDFWENAVAYRQRGVISSELGVHNYLPAFTLLMAPWAYVPLRVAIVVFTLLSLAAFAHTVLLCRDIVRRIYPKLPDTYLAAAVGLMLAYVTSCAVVGAWGLILTWLVVLTWSLHARGRDHSAGVALGMAAILKLLPAILLGYFILARRWRLVAASVLTVVVIGGVVPLLALGPREFVDQHRGFSERAIEGHSAWRTIHDEKPQKANFSNNALPVVLRRLLSPINAGKGEDENALHVNIADVPAGTIWIIYVILAGGLLLFTAGLTVLSTTPHSQNYNQTNKASASSASSVAHPPNSVAATQLAFAAWCCLMLLLSPLVWTHYLPLVLWPLTLLAARGMDFHATHRRPHRLIAFALLAWLAAVVALASPAARAVGAQIASVLILWIVIVVELARMRRATSPPASA